MKVRLGIDLGGTSIKIGVVDEKYRIVYKQSIPTDADSKSFSEIVKNMALAAQAAAEAAGYDIKDFPCVGIGSPSYINPHTGLLVFFNNTNWRNVPLRQELQKYIPVPVFIGNDANCAVVGEALAGSAKGYDNVLMLTLGTGIGSGLIINGKLYCGADGMGAELGHTTFVYGGEACTCGRKGCYESYASVSALIRQTKDAMRSAPDSLMHGVSEEQGNKVTGRTAFDAAKMGDEAALRVVDRYIDYVASGISGFVNIYILHSIISCIIDS